MSTNKNKFIILFALFLCVAGQLWYNSARLSRVFYFISLLVAIFGILMFYLSFEDRKPKEREVVLVCVLCALAVSSRVMFFFSPQIKPMAAIIIISAVCYGKETGFLVGSLSMFLSNFFFSQGPFTPFSMVGMGLVGYLAGVLFNGKKPPVWQLCIYGFFSVYLIYGGIMNTSTALLHAEKLSPAYLFTFFIAGFYFDLTHSISTVIFIWLLYESLLSRFSRVKKRYGMMRS